jgi:uncharacterized membrane protein YkvA (DUF1232 family)
MFGRLQRVLALLRDPRVGRLPRFGVLAAAAYLLWPIDLLPDFLVPVGGYLDDAVLLWLSVRWLFKSDPSAASPSSVAPPLQR